MKNESLVCKECIQKYLLQQCLTWQKKEAKLMSINRNTKQQAATEKNEASTVGKGRFREVHYKEPILVNQFLIVCVCVCACVKLYDYREISEE